MRRKGAFRSARGAKPLWKISALALILLYFFTFVTCQREKNDSEPLRTISPGEIPDVEITDFRDNYLDGTNKIWILDARKAKIFEYKRYIKLEKLKFFIFKNNRVTSKIIADYGTIYNDSRNIVAESNVTVKSEDGTLLYTDYLIWDERRGKLLTDKYVKIVRPNRDVITGYGLETDRELKEVIIKKRVKGTIYEQLEN